MSLSKRYYGLTVICLVSLLLTILLYDVTIQDGGSETELPFGARQEFRSWQNVARNRRREQNVFVIAICRRSHNSSSIQYHKNLLEMPLVLLKSAVAMTMEKLKFVVLSDSRRTFTEFEELVREEFGEDEWKTLSLEHREILYPRRRRRMKDVFKPCSTARLMVPLSVGYDSVVYLDNDSIFLRPPEHLWNKFTDFGEKEVIGVAQTNGFYNTMITKQLKIPFYKDTGLNPGVMLMNLTRIDQFPGGWIDTLVTAYDTYKDHITVGDQDLMNAVFSSRPEYVNEIGCEWNFLGIFCFNRRIPCVRAQKYGISLLHDNGKRKLRGYLGVLFRSWKAYKMDSSLEQFWKLLKSKLEDVDPRTCSQVKDMKTILTKWANDNWFYIFIGNMEDR